MKKNIDVIVSLIDNFGDVGFCTEVLIGLESLEPEKYHYRIWTDQKEKVDIFLQYNLSEFPEYSLYSLSDFGLSGRSELCLIFFHAEIPGRQYFQNGSLILRIDYLSLDPEWTLFHESEHILSTLERKILEIIPSPFPSG
jgi:hypothetical protein